MIIALKVTLSYLVALVSAFSALGGMFGALLLHDAVCLIPAVLGTFLLIFVAHSPMRKYIEGSV